jgi:signal peptidase I
MSDNFKLNTENKEKSSRFWSTIFSFVLIILSVIVLLKLFVFQQVTVVGASMEPNYHTAEGLLVNQLNKNFQRGQVVAVYKDKEVAETANFFTKFKAVMYLKRIIGLPGEYIEIVQDKVIICKSDGFDCNILKEDYIPQSTKDKMIAADFYRPKIKIADDCYFVMGDNRTNSTDSRDLGCFTSKALFGGEVLKFWPSEKFELFNLPIYQYLPVDSKTQSLRDRAQLRYTIRS